MEDKSIKRSSTSAGNQSKKSQTLHAVPTPSKAGDLNLNLKIGIGSLEEDMMSFLKTTDVSPKTMKSEENESLKRDLQKSQTQIHELQEQLKKLKELSRRALDDFEHYKHGMELEKIRYKESQFTIENLKRNQCGPEELQQLQETKSYLENQVNELKEEVMNTKESKSRLEKLLEESRAISNAYEQQINGIKNNFETENKSKQQLTSFNSEIGKELKQLTTAKKDLENSLSNQLEKLSRMQMQLSTMDNELIRVGNDLEKEKLDHRIDLEKLKVSENSLNSTKKLLDATTKEKEEKCNELSGLKLKYELLIGELHVKNSEIGKLKSDVKYEENMRMQLEKQVKNLQELLRKRAENSQIQSDIEINKILTFLKPFEDQKSSLEIDIKQLIEDKSAILSEIRDKVKEYEVVRFKQEEVKKPVIEAIVKPLPIDNVVESNSTHDIKNSKESLDTSNLNWRDKANNMIKKKIEDDIDENSKTKTIRMLGEGTMRAKQLRNLTMAKLKKNKVVLFGGLLQERADFECRPVPKIVLSCIKTVDQKGLSTEGIYRRAGAMKEMRAMQDEWEAGNPIDMSNDMIDILSISSLLKAYFRDLKVPLIPNDVYDLTVYILKEPKLNDDILNTFKENLKKLPIAHYNTLYYLIQHLKRYFVFI